MSHSLKFFKFLPRFLRSDKSKSIPIEHSLYSSRDTQCRLLFLDDSDLIILIKGSIKGLHVYEQAFSHLNLQERDYFGLRYLDYTGQNHWLEPQKSLSSQLKYCLSPVTLYFGVKFYPADPCKLKEEVTRYQFFLQIKQDVCQGRLPVSHSDAPEIFAYCLQSELGDFDPNRHTVGYVSEFRFVPNQTEELEETIAAHHRRLVGQVPAIAEYKFLDKVKWLDMYGVDLHPVLGDFNTEYFLGLTPTGIVVYKNKTKVGNYFWPRITKITYRGKVFITRVKDKNNDEHTYAFELVTKAAVKHLWKCCVEHHTFFRLNQLAGPYTSAAKLLKLGSKYKFSGRQNRLNQSEFQDRPQSSVQRVQSKRHPRRTSSDPRLNMHMNEMSYNVSRGTVSVMATPEPVKPPRHRSLPELQGRESPRSVHSAPWESNVDMGMYTSGRDSPLSMHSELLRRYHKKTGASDSDSVYRRKYFPNKKGSDNESDVSHSRRRRREADSGSESDISPSRHYSRTRSTGGDFFEGQKNDGVHGHGSVPSVRSAVAIQAQQKRARRRRSKSPGHRPPEELKQHIEFDLVEGLSEDQMREIPYVSVETRAEPFKLQIAAKLRHRYRSPKRKSFGETVHVNSGHVEEPPPPYSPPPYSPPAYSPGLAVTDRPSRATHNRQHSTASGHHGPPVDLVVKSSPSVYKYQAHQAPVVKTRPTSTHNESLCGIEDKIPTKRNHESFADSNQEQEIHKNGHFHQTKNLAHRNRYSSLSMTSDQHSVYKSQEGHQRNQSHGQYQVGERLKNPAFSEGGRSFQIHGDHGQHWEDQRTHPTNRSFVDNQENSQQGEGNQSNTSLTLHDHTHQSHGCEPELESLSSETTERSRSEVSSGNRSVNRSHLEDDRRHSGVTNEIKNIGSSQQEGKTRDAIDGSGNHSMSSPHYSNASIGGRTFGDVSKLDRSIFQLEGNQQLKTRNHSRNDEGTLEENNNWTGKPRLSQGTPEKENVYSSHKQLSPGRMFGTLADINRMYTAGAVLSPAQKGQQSLHRSAFIPSTCKMSPPSYQEYEQEHSYSAPKSNKLGTNQQAYCNNIPQMLQSPNTRRDYWTEL
ncbi:hypothetical protein ScPMuIL_017718 [Solemya velum]